MRKTLAPLLAAATLAGCVPGRVPEVSEGTGVVRNGGAPAASVTVVWEDRNPSDSTVSVRETRTDSLGVFSFEGERRWGM